MILYNSTFIYYSTLNKGGVILLYFMKLVPFVFKDKRWEPCKEILDGKRLVYQISKDLYQKMKNPWVKKNSRDIMKFIQQYPSSELSNDYKFVKNQFDCKNETKKFVLVPFVFREIELSDVIRKVGGL